MMAQVQKLRRLDSRVDANPKVGTVTMNVADTVTAEKKVKLIPRIKPKHSAGMA